jgi:hypothetical protein
VRNDSGAYSLVLALPQGTHIDAPHRMDVGDWLFSVESPTELPPGSGAFFQAEDVVRFDGVLYTTFLDGSVAGVPPGSNVDGIFLNGSDSGDLILGFDVPTAIPPNTFDPADQVRFAGGLFTLFFDASAAAPTVPGFANGTGADQSGGDIVLPFDIPTTLGPTFLPGELVSWDGATFSSFYSDAAWPLSSREDALPFLANPGTIPPTLTVAKAVTFPLDLTLSWSGSCSVGAEDYGVYKGTLPSFYTHGSLVCTTGGATTVTITPSAGDTYYLVVPNHPNDEGSYGLDSGGLQRPQGGPACRVTQAIGCP